MRSILSIGALMVLLGLPAVSPGATAELVAVAGGFDVIVDTDAQLQILTVGIRTADGCSDCTFLFDNQRLVDGGLQGAEFLNPLVTEGADPKIGLEKVGSFSVSGEGAGVDFLTVQASTLAGGVIPESQAGPLNGTTEFRFRLGTLQTAATTPEFVPNEELAPVVGNLQFRVFSNGGGGPGPDADMDGALDADDNCPFEPNNSGGDVQLDSDGDGTGDACECGNVDRSTDVDIFDALMIAQGTLSPPIVPITHPRACDCDGSGGCDIFDALHVAKASLEPPMVSILQSCPAATMAPGD
jgi:hypothetical protein